MKYTSNEIKSIKDSALAHFGYYPLLYLTSNADKAKAIKKRKRIEKIVDVFLAEAPNYRFQSEEEAVNKIGPTVSWILWFFFRKLVTEVIIWLYNNYYD